MVERGNKMTQEQLKEQFIEYAKDNMNNLTILEAIKVLLDNITSGLYYDGYVTISNRLTTAALIIDEITKND